MSVRRRDRHQFAFRDHVIGLRPLAYWPMDERTGLNTRVWEDFTRRGRDMTSNGNSPRGSLLRRDRAGFAQVFSGLQEGSNADAAWHDVTDFTIMLNVLTTSGTSVGASAGLFSKGTTATDANNPYGVRYNASGTTLFLFIGNNTTAQNLQLGSASQFITGRTHQIIITADGTTLRAYEGGRQFTSAAQTHTPFAGASSLYIGRGFAYANNTRMSHVALWDRALSAGDVSAMYHAAMS
jgi:hypothetical protein